MVIRNFLTSIFPIIWLGSHLNMQNQELGRSWIETALTITGVKKKDLAAAIGLNSVKITKILIGERRITDAETHAAIAFFTRFSNLTYQEMPALAAYGLLVVLDPNKPAHLPCPPDLDLDPPSVIAALTKRLPIGRTELARRAGLTPAQLAGSLSGNRRLTFEQLGNLAAAFHQILLTQNPDRIRPDTFTLINSLPGKTEPQAERSAATLGRIAITGRIIASRNGLVIPVADQSIDRPKGLITAVHAFALTVSGESLRPAYRADDLVIADPDRPVRIGDDAIVTVRTGNTETETLLRQLVSESGTEYKLATLDGKKETVARENMAGIARILRLSEILNGS